MDNAQIPQNKSNCTDKKKVRNQQHIDFFRMYAS